MRTDRAELFQRVERVVVKVGTYLLTGVNTPLNPETIGKIVAQIAELKRRGKEVVLVTSGAIGAGVLELKLKERPRDLPGLQAAAAVGQTNLMHIYRDFFHKEGFAVGQILLSREDLHHRCRHLNVRNTLSRLLRDGVVPVINENDTVSVEEIKFGDNDFLSALVCNLLQADLLAMLTDVEGLLCPAADRGGGFRAISCVEKITPEMEKLVFEDSKELSRGGMRSKLEAARIVTRAGGMVVIASGRRENVLVEIVEGKEVGTLFLPAAKKVGSRKSWIAYSCLKKGTITVDEGARQALVEKGKSLLASGVTGTENDFRAGEMVGIKGPDGVEVARGLVNYSRREVEMIKGKKSNQIKTILGEEGYREVVHRDNLVVL